MGKQLGIVNRPWGSYEVLSLEEDFWIKILRIKAGHRTSLQSHKKRKEYWTVISGTGFAEIDGWDVAEFDTYELRQGNHFCVPLDTKHRLTASDKSEELVICEIALGQPEENDIERFEDDYGRAK